MRTRRRIEDMTSTASWEGGGSTGARRFVLVESWAPIEWTLLARSRASCNVDGSLHEAGPAGRAPSKDGSSRFSR